MATLVYAVVFDEVVDALLVQSGGKREGPPIVPTMTFKDFGADSLDLVELIMTFEDRYGIKIPDEDARKLRTVGDATDYIIEHQPVVPEE